MGHRHDWVDWVGGLPFVVTKPQPVFDYLVQRRFVLERFTTCGGGGACNEFVFRRSVTPGQTSNPLSDTPNA